jgi:hypothetical protein
MATNDDASTESTPEVLDVRDVLSATHFDRPDADSLGAQLTFTTVGDRTIVSVDAEGVDPVAPLQIATLEGITGITLQQLLNNVDIAC